MLFLSSMALRCNHLSAWSPATASYFHVAEANGVRHHDESVRGNRSETRVGSPQEIAMPSTCRANGGDGNGSYLRSILGGHLEGRVAGLVI